MKTATTTAINLGNNEAISRGITANADGTFTAVTFTASKTFKTYAGACKWMAARLSK
jgi:hypothetical protein